MAKEQEEDYGKLRPFLKWAGGKYRILSTLKKRFPAGQRFIEPFLGAGSVSLNVEYPSYIVSDTNGDLILVWQILKTMGPEFILECEKLFVPETNSRAVFDQFKKEFNKTKNDLRKAILFIYLNRHCFNGLCRYNSRGEFNVPFGKYNAPHFPQKAFQDCLDKIQKFEIHNKDFREIFSMVGRDDVVYCDPPYLPMSESASFDSYSIGGFSLQDHLDLATCAEKAASKGATVIISNHHNWYSRQIYSDMHCARISAIEVARTISGTTDKRNAVKEIIAVFKKGKHNARGVTSNNSRVHNTGGSQEDESQEEEGCKIQGGPSGQDL